MRSLQASGQPLSFSHTAGSLRNDPSRWTTTGLLRQGHFPLCLPSARPRRLSIVDVSLPVGTHSSTAYCRSTVVLCLGTLVDQVKRPLTAAVKPDPRCDQHPRRRLDTLCSVMSATMFDRTSALEDEGAVTIPLPSRRSRRLSLPSTMPSSLRRRSRLPTPSPSDGERTASDKAAMPHIPFASPPYMPMFGASSSSSSLVSSPPSRTKADVRRSMPISLLPVSTTPSTPSQTSSRPRHLRTESSRFRRRLARWTSSSSRDELDFGCAGNNSNSNWLEGPQDLVGCDVRRLCRARERF